MEKAERHLARHGTMQRYFARPGIPDPSISDYVRHGAALRPPFSFGKTFSAGTSLRCCSMFLKFPWLPPGSARCRGRLASSFTPRRSFTVRRSPQMVLLGPLTTLQGSSLTGRGRPRPYQRCSGVQGSLSCLPRRYPFPHTVIPSKPFAFAQDNRSQARDPYDLTL